MAMEARAQIEAMRSALLSAAQAAYDDARIRGLCSEGAWEIACGVIRAYDLSPFTTHRIEAESIARHRSPQ